VSLTGVDHVFVGVHENGINHLLQALFTARPRYINFGSTFFVPLSTTNATHLDPISITIPSLPPYSTTSLPVIIEYAVSFSIPSMDLFPDSSGGTSPLPPGPGQFSLHTDVTLTVGCARRVQRPNNDRPPSGSLVPITTKLGVWARGKPTVNYTGPGVGDIGFEIDDIKLESITPDSLEAALECVIRMILEGAISTVHIPFEAVTFRSVTLILARGPEVADDQVKLYGDLL
jgi:hypothetical protein